MSCAWSAQVGWKDLFCSPKRNFWSLCSKFRGSGEGMSSTFPPGMEQKGCFLAELRLKLCPVFINPRYFMSSCTPFLFPGAQSLDFCHPILGFGWGHALHLLPEDQARMLFSRGVSCESILIFWCFLGILCPLGTLFCSSKGNPCNISIQFRSSVEGISAMICRKLERKGLYFPTLCARAAHELRTSCAA